MNIDKFFEPLRQHQAQVSEQAWEKLAKKLPAQRKKNRKWAWFGLTFLVLASTVFLPEKQSNNRQKTALPTVKNAVYEQKTVFYEPTVLKKNEPEQKIRENKKVVLSENNALEQAIISKKIRTHLDELPIISAKLLEVQNMEILPQKSIEINIIIKRGGEQPESYHIETFEKNDSTKTQFGRILKQLSHLKNGEKVNFDQFRRYPTKN